ncbi:MAG: SLC13 family permease [Candidatus Bathyarchaeia archaeon]
MVLSETQKRALVLSVLSFVTLLLAYMFGLNQSQMTAVTVFSFNIYATLLFWRYRLPFGFLAISVLLALNVIDIPHLIEFASFDVILFLISMMTVVGVLEERGFFEQLLHRITGKVGSNGYRLMIVLMLASGLFAALVDEVTSILFMTALILHLTGKHDLNPVPFILMLVFATNIGSSATVVGNPVGVMIAFKGGLAFSDFLRWATPISVTALFVTVLISLKLFSEDIKELSSSLQSNETVHADEEVYMEGNWTSWFIFIGAITLLALHHTLEELFHLEKNVLLIGIAMGVAGVSLLINLEKGREVVERRVDWMTLLFFTLLFASVGTLEYVGVTDLIASGILSISGMDEVYVLLTLAPIASILSAFMDNVLAIAMFIPIVSNLAEAGVYAFPLWWAMLFAGTFFGNLTLIGSTANIVANGILEREGRGHITFMEWFKVGALVSISTMALAVFLIWVQMPFMPR